MRQTFPFTPHIGGIDDAFRSVSTVFSDLDTTWPRYEIPCPDPG